MMRREDIYKRSKMAEFVHKCQRIFCAYDVFGFGIGKIGDTNLTQEDLNKRKPPTMCDCKFGATNISGAGERGNGCPEMRCVYAILDNMTDKEFERIIKRINKRAKKGWRQYKKDMERLHKISIRDATTLQE